MGGNTNSLAESSAKWKMMGLSNKVLDGQSMSFTCSWRASVFKRAIIHGGDGLGKGSGVLQGKTSCICRQSLSQPSSLDEGQIREWEKEFKHRVPPWRIWIHYTLFFTCDVISPLRSGSSSQIGSSIGSGSWWWQERTKFAAGRIGSFSNLVLE